MHSQYVDGMTNIVNPAQPAPKNVGLQIFCSLHPSQTAITELIKQAAFRIMKCFFDKIEKCACLGTLSKAEVSQCV